MERISKEIKINSFSEVVHFIQSKIDDKSFNGNIDKNRFELSKSNSGFKIIGNYNEEKQVLTLDIAYDNYQTGTYKGVLYGAYCIVVPIFNITLWLDNDILFIIKLICLLVSIGVIFLISLLSKIVSFLMASNSNYEEVERLVQKIDSSGNLAN